MRRSHRGKENPIVSHSEEREDHLPAALAAGRCAPYADEPTDSCGWNALGAERFGQGDYVAAAECFRRAVTLDPRNYAAIANLVETLVSLDRFREAVAIAEQWTRSLPGCADAWVTWARLNLLAGRAAEARQALVRANALDPGRRSIAEALLALGDASETGEAAVRPGRPSSSGASPLPFLRPLDPAPRAPARCDPPILWIGPALFPGGYSYLTRQSVLWLRRAGWKVELDPLGTPDDAYLETKDVADLEELKAAMQTRTRDGVAVLCHQPAVSTTDLALQARWRRPDHLAYVLFAMFETAGLPAHWIGPCNGMDQIWVPSSFNVRTFAEAGVAPDRIRAIGFGIDAAFYDPERVAPMEVKGRRGFMFLSVFQWQARKGWPLLVEAFARAFSHRDDVCLVIKTFRQGSDRVPVMEKIDRYLAARSMSRSLCAPIIVIEDGLSDTAMRSLYRAADAFVLPSRGEGWGTHYMEAMAMGLPTIATEWSGHLDFMNHSNSYLIRVRRLVEADAEVVRVNPEFAGLHYAEPDLDHLVHLMRQVYEDRDSARLTGRRARADICANWTHTRYVERVRRAARELISRAQGRRLGSFVRPRRARSDILPVIVHGPALDPSGYAHDFRNLCLGLARAGVDVRLDHQRWNSRDGLVAADECARIVALMNPERPAGRHIAIENPLWPPPDPDPDAYRILRLHWETDRLPPALSSRCAAVDEVWASSTAVMNAVIRSGVPREKVRIVPCGLAMERYGPHVAPLPWADPKRFTFLATFDLSLRKGWDIILRAFFREFRPQENVDLALNVHSSRGGREFAHRHIEEWARRLAGPAWVADDGSWRSEQPPIFFVTEDLHADDMPRFYRSGDAYLMPSRGEGWGLPAMEAMASGLPVIATGWGGHLDFMDSDTEFLLPFRLVPVSAEACREVPLFAGQMWAEPVMEELRRKMRLVKEAREFARGRAAAARERIRSRFDRYAVAEAAAERLAAISSELRGDRRVGRRARPSVRSVAWEGCILYRSSLALVNRELCSRLARDDRFRLELIPLEPTRHEEVCDSENLKLLQARMVQSHDDPCDVYVRHAWPPEFARPPRARRFVMIQPWEFGRLPQPWLRPICESVDEIWVPSRHVFETYVASGVPAQKVWLVPNGVDTNLFTPDGKALDLPTEKSFRFLFVGGTIWRKGIDVLLKAYCSAFGRGDDVCLVVKEMGADSFYRGQCATEAIRAIQSRPDAPEVLYLTSDLAPDEMAALYRSCTCLVLPYRGEGFGLPVAEAAACGLPVIVSAGGATDDFVPLSSGYFVETRRCSVRLQGELATDGWVLEPVVSSLVEQMQRVISDGDERRRRAASLCAHIRKHFTWELAAAAMIQRLAALTGDDPLGHCR